MTTPRQQGICSFDLHHYPLKWKSPSREVRIQFNHTLWKAMSMSLTLQVRNTSGCRTYFISRESDEKTASGKEISLSQFWTAKIKSPLSTRLKTTHALNLLIFCTHIISLTYLKKFTVVGSTSIAFHLGRSGSEMDDPCFSNLRRPWSEMGLLGYRLRSLIFWERHQAEWFFLRVLTSL